MNRSRASAAALALAAASVVLGQAEARAACAPIPFDDMVSWWRGDGTGADTVGSDDAVLTAPAGYTTGKVGQAFDFSAGGKALPSGVDWRLTPPGFTVEFWARSVAATERMVDGAYDADYNDGWYVGLAAGTARGCVGDGSATSCVQSAASIGNNVFHHVAMTWASSDNILRLYVDGTIRNTNYVEPAEGVGFLLWGGGFNGTSQFHGQIDELAIYSRALSASEIASIAAAGSDGKCGCGDGQVEAGETCDPGADACCNSTCSGYDAACQCGNGQVEAHEACDPEAEGGECCTSTCDGFDRACQCGDGVYQEHELCDPGLASCCNSTCDGYLADGASCETGAECWGGATCSAGVCQGASEWLCCGDGTLQYYEWCDPSVPGDQCCDETCFGFAAGRPCDDGNECTGGDSCQEYPGCWSDTWLCCGDGEVQTPEQCDSAGDTCCSADCNYANGAPCDDGDECTVGDSCSSGACTSGGPLECDDDNPCTHDSCDEGCIFDASPLPETSCLLAPQTSLKVKLGTRDTVKWSMKNGEALALESLGDPTEDAGYTLCVYDGEGASWEEWMSLPLEAGPLWTPTKLGFRYESAEGWATRLDIRSGDAGRSSLKLGIKGWGITGGATQFFDQDPTVVVQLVGPAGFCASTTFLPSDTSANKPESFSAKTR